MGTLQLILGIVLLVLAVFLVVVVLMQSGKTDKLSGTITGASSDSFYGKSKGRTADAILSQLTAVAAILFALIVIAFYVVQTHTATAEETETEDTSISEEADATVEDAIVEDATVTAEEGDTVAAE